MRIAWITDLTLNDEKHGGAEITESYMIEEGVKREHQIDIFTPITLTNADEVLYKYDLFIINNCVMFDKEQIRKIRDNFLKPFVTYNHDYNFCAFRNADCALYNNCDICEKDRNELFDFFSKAFKKAELNIFLSPLHLELTAAKCKNIINNSVVIPPPINLEKFKPNAKARKPGTYLYFGNIYKGKGIDQVLKDYKHLGKKLHFAGQFWDPSFKMEILKDHTYIGEIPHNKIPEVLATYENFIRYTPLKESFGRSTVEAMACGCNIVSKTQIGAESFGIPAEELLKKCSEAPKVFWNKVEEVIENGKES